MQSGEYESRTVDAPEWHIPEIPLCGLTADTLLYFRHLGVDVGRVHAA